MSGASWFYRWPLADFLTAAFGYAGERQAAYATPPFPAPTPREHRRSRPPGPASMLSSPVTSSAGGAWETARNEHPVTKDGNNARKKAARELAAAEHITYTEALRRVDQRAARTPPAGEQSVVMAGEGRVTAQVTRPVATLTTDVVLIGHTGVAGFVAFHPDGHTLVSSGDVTARLWDLATRQATTVLTCETRVISAALSPDGHTLAVACQNVEAAVASRFDPDIEALWSVTLWAIATGQITTFTGSAGRVLSVAFSPDGGTLATSEIQPPELIHDSAGHPRVLPSPEAGSSSTIRLWDLATGEATTVSSLQGRSQGRALAFHPSGHILAHSPGIDGTILLRHLDTGQTTTLAGHASSIQAAAFSPDGRTLATASDDATIRLWDPATGQLTITLTPHGGYVVAVAFSPDGRTLASASTDRTVRLWDPATGQHTATLFGHTDFVTSMAFSPGGHTLATASRDGTVRLWTLANPPR